MPVEAPVLGFVGRLVRDKGVAELFAAYKELRRDIPRLFLLLVGPFEDYDKLDANLRSEISSDPQIVQTGFLKDAEVAYPLMTLLALPTYREGFSYALMEAASMELPVVATRVTGCVDAVVDGQTGVLVPPQDAHALAAAIRAYLLDRGACRRHGTAGRKRVIQEFQPRMIWESLDHEYRELLWESRTAARAPQDARTAVPQLN